MKAARHTFAMLLAALTLHAGVIDVSSSESVLVSGGDTLSFELFTGSYRSAARQFGLALDPAVLRFALVTAPLTSGQEFSATLRSADSTVFLEQGGPLDFDFGTYASSRFQGDVSILQGQFLLDSREAGRLLQSRTLWLEFTNLGGNLELGLEPLTLGRSLYVSLSGGPLSVGALNGTVLLQQPDLRSSSRIIVEGLQQNGFTATPEPGSAWTMLLGGVLLLGFSASIRRLFRTRK
jgi:hypothetical protein